MDDVGKLKVDFEADISDFKIAISEVKSLMKDVGNETRKSTGDFALLAGVTAGLANFGLNAIKDGIQGIIGGITEYLSLNPDFVMAQTELDQTFREIANDVGPGVVDVMTTMNTILTDMKDKGFFDDVNKGLIAMSDAAIWAYEKIGELQYLLGLTKEKPEGSNLPETNENTPTMEEIAAEGPSIKGASMFLDYRMQNPLGEVIVEGIAGAIRDLIVALFPSKSTGGGGAD